MNYAIIIGKNNKELGGLYYSSFFNINVVDLMNEALEMLDMYNQIDTIRNDDEYKMMLYLFNTYKNLSSKGFSIKQIEPFVDNWSEDFFLNRFPGEGLSFNEKDYRTISFSTPMINHFKTHCNGYIYIDLEKATIKLDLFRKVNKTFFDKWRKNSGYNKKPSAIVCGLPLTSIEIRINSFSDIKQVVEASQYGYEYHGDYYIPDIKEG